MYRRCRYQGKCLTNTYPLFPFVVRAGAVHALSSEFSIDGNAWFTNNSASTSGGEKGGTSCIAQDEVQVANTLSGILLLQGTDNVVICDGKQMKHGTMEIAPFGREGASWTQ